MRVPYVSSFSYDEATRILEVHMATGEVRRHNISKDYWEILDRSEDIETCYKSLIENHFPSLAT